MVALTVKNISRTSQSICWSQRQISRQSGLIRDARNVNVKC